MSSVVGVLELINEIKRIKNKMIVIFAKILSIFSIVLIGFIANKLNWLPIESSKYLSKILINISAPCLILYSMSYQKMSENALTPIIEVISLMLIVLIICSLISIPIVKTMRVNKGDRGIYRLMLICTNSGFIGFPLAQAVFGNEGLFLMILANATFSIFLFTGGVLLLTYDTNREKKSFSELLKSLISVPMVASISGLAIFLFNLSFPEILENMLSTVGAMTTPISMLIIGIQLPGIKLKQMIMDKHLLLTTIIRLILIPVALFTVLINFNITPLVLCVIVFAMALPSAALIVVFADEYRLNARLASEGVLLTTSLSLVTIPIAAALLTAYLGV